MVLPCLLNGLSLLPFVFSSVLFFTRLEGSSAAVSNRTIDDEFGDSVTGQKPVFLPDLPGIWQGEECACPVTPDKTKTFKQTFNAATYKPELGATSIGLNFKGTAIYVFFTIANTINGGLDTTLTECNFTIDGEHAGYYRHEPAPDSSFLYQVLVFTSENLQNTDHMLNISTSGLDYHTFTNFDYAIYTFDDSPPAPPPANSPNPPPTNPPGTGTSSTSASNPTVTSTNTPPPNRTTTGSAPVVVIQSGTASPPQGGTQNPNTAAGQATQISNSILPNQTGSPDNRGTPVGTIAGGSAGGVALILLVLLLFILYRRQKRIDKAKLTAVTAVPGPGTTAAAVEVIPFMGTTDYSSSYPDTLSASGTSSSAPMVQRPNPAALNPKFPPSGYVDPFRDRYAHARMDSLESSGDGTRRTAEDESPVRHRSRRGGRGEVRNANSNSSTTSHERHPTTRSEPVDVVTESMETDHVRVYEREKVIGQITTPSATASTESSDDVSARRRRRRPRRSQRPLGADLETQLREVQEDMRELRVRTGHPRSRDSVAEVAQMREQMQLMQEHIMYLQHLQGSAGPPPEYSTAITERRVEGI